jgi:hypothetical protein
LKHSYIALISDVPELTLEALGPIAHALQVQANKQFKPMWGIHANVEAFTETTIPTGFWPIRILANIGQPGAAGYHTDANNQPYAEIQYAPDWTVTASHEMLEMLFDPFGNALIPAVVNGQHVQVLQELCDPCEAFSYLTGDDVAVSDFVTPYYYERAVVPNQRYSFLGNLSGPMAVAVDGYLSYLDGNEWFQITNFSGQGIQVVDLGPNDKAGRQGLSLKEWVQKFK